LVARDEKNDLAVIRVTRHNISAPLVAAFRDGAAVRAGDAVVALGYPLSWLLASTASLSVGNVSALAGLGDDSRYLQISAPVQPGNSGGPLLDASGHLIGIVTSKLNAARVARITGDIPQNVNFALKAEVAKTFLDSKGIAYRIERSELQLAPADVGDNAGPFTVHIQCEQANSRTTAIIPPSKRIELTSEQMQQHIEHCNGRIKASDDQLIDGCSAVIFQSGPCGNFVCGNNAYWAFKNRGVGYFRKGIFEGAINDFTQAIQLNPSAEVLRFRGGAFAAIGKYDEAFDDWTQSMGAGKGTAYWLLWNYIISGHAGNNEVPWTRMSAVLATGIRMGGVSKVVWPFPVIEFYLGNRFAPEMLSAASTPAERCEAQFYLGEWHLLRGNLAAATASLRIAVTTCPKNFYEYDGAVAELARINKSKRSEIPTQQQ
jgi:tetratricopeptide (TPR) repeat protein